MQLGREDLQVVHRNLPTFPLIHKWIFTGLWSALAEHISAIPPLTTARCAQCRFCGLVVSAVRREDARRK